MAVGGDRDAAAVGNGVERRETGSDGGAPYCIGFAAPGRRLVGAGRGWGDHPDRAARSSRSATVSCAERARQGRHHRRVYDQARRRGRRHGGGHRLGCIGHHRIRDRHQDCSTAMANDWEHDPGEHTDGLEDSAPPTDRTMTAGADQRTLDAAPPFCAPRGRERADTVAMFVALAAIERMERDWGIGRQPCEVAGCYLL